MYSSPTASRKCNRCCISTRMPPAISSCCRVRVRPSKKYLASRMVSAETSQILLPLMRTARASARRRVPLQSGQVGVAAILAQHHAHVQLVFLALQKGEETVDAEKRPVPVEHKLLLGRGQFSPGRVERDAMLHGGLPELCLVGPIFGASPGIDGAFVQRLLLIRDDQVEIEVDGVAKALAALAGAIRVVEREQPGLRLAVDAVAKFAFKGLGEAEPFGFHFSIPGNGFVHNFA